MVVPRLLTSGGSNHASAIDFNWRVMIGLAVTCDSISRWLNEIGC